MDSEKQLIGIGVGLVAGFLQKKWFNGSKWYRFNIPNSLIPYINTAIGAVAGTQITDLGVMGGMVTGLASVGGHQAVKIPVKKATGRSI